VIPVDKADPSWTLTVSATTDCSAAVLEEEKTEAFLICGLDASVAVARRGRHRRARSGGRRPRLFETGGWEPGPHGGVAVVWGLDLWLDGSGKGGC
jgi:hypothetical protein